MRKHGPKRIPIEVRFWPKVLKSDGCWLWTGAKMKHGYGVMGSGGKHGTVLAHRVSWELANGAIPEGLDVLHHCDTPSCVRPDHLFIGTAKDNAIDAVLKGRPMGRFARRGIA